MLRLFELTTMTRALLRDAPLRHRRLLPRAALAPFVALVLSASGPASAWALQPQRPATSGAPRCISLDEALRIADAQSEAVDVARAGVTRATGQRFQSRSQSLPQVGAVAGYTRLLQSQFSDLVATPVDTGPPAPPSLCAPRIPVNATPGERSAALAQATTCPSGSGGFDFTQTGFGAANQWTLGLQVSQNVYTGGRIQGQNAASDAQLRSANIEVSAQRAQTALDVTQAYYDAVLADQLVAIADSSVAQTAETLRQTKLGRELGTQSEFELLRAQVTHDNQQPDLIRSRRNRDIAYYRLKQLLNVPLDEQLALTTQIEGASGPLVPTIVTTSQPDTAVSSRAPVRELEEAVQTQQGLLKVAKSEKLPSVSITSGYQRLYFPLNAFPNITDARQNWNVGITASIPVFTGGRTKGSEMAAQASLDETRARLRQTREFAALDARVALSLLAEAEATWRASAGTAGQAQRAYSIDQVRYREGISTQTELTQSRLLLEQASANRALAARNLAVARVRLALLRDLPLQPLSTPDAAAGGAAAGQGLTRQQPQQQRAAQQTAGGQANPLGGITP